MKCFPNIRLLKTIWLWFFIWMICKTYCKDELQVLLSEYLMHRFYNLEVSLVNHMSLLHSYSVHWSIIPWIPTTTNKGLWVSLLVYGLGLPSYFLVICLKGKELRKVFFKKGNKYAFYLLGILERVIFISKCIVSLKENN